MNEIRSQIRSMVNEAMAVNRAASATTDITNPLRRMSSPGGEETGEGEQPFTATPPYFNSVGRMLSRTRARGQDPIKIYSAQNKL
jgi:hypothetical protein